MAEKLRPRHIVARWLEINSNKSDCEFREALEISTHLKGALGEIAAAKLGLGRIISHTSPVCGDVERRGKTIEVKATFRQSTTKVSKIRGSPDYFLFLKLDYQSVTGNIVLKGYWLGPRSKFVSDRPNTDQFENGPLAYLWRKQKKIVRRLR